MLWLVPIWLCLFLILLGTGLWLAALLGKLAGPSLRGPFDVFQLFWSSNSMHSDFVRQEWEHALRLNRPHFIRPTYWEEPMPMAPEKVVLSAAMQDFIDEARLTDDADWLSLSRAARTLSRERIEDYVAAATATGPLVPTATRTPEIVR